MKKGESEVDKKSQRESQDNVTDAPGDSAEPQSTPKEAEEINVKDPHLVQSQEDIRLTQASPLDAPLENALLTQEIRAAFAEEGGVIHEVDEEENENAAEEAEGQRVSLLKPERALASQGGEDENLETKQNFVASAHIKHAAEVDSLQQQTVGGDSAQ